MRSQPFILLMLPVCGESFVSWCFQDFLCVFVFQQSDYHVSRHVSHLGLVMFLGRMLRRFIKFGQRLAIISSNTFQPLFLSLLTLGFSLHTCCYAWYCPTGFWGSVHFSSIFWVFCDSNWIISIDLSSSLIPSSIILNLLLGPSSEFFLFQLLYFSLRNFCLASFYF